MTESITSKCWEVNPTIHLNLETAPSQLWMLISIHMLKNNQPMKQLDYFLKTSTNSMQNLQSLNNGRKTNMQRR